MKFYTKIYEDDNIIVINKESGILSIPDRYDPLIPSLDKILKRKYENIFIVHRLDKETSGIMVFAKDSESHKSLNEQFQKRKLTKFYHVLVAGIVSEDKIDIDIPLMPNPGKKPGMIPSARGKESLSKLRVIERFRHATFAEVDLVTGRHHQLRAHVAAIGHPLLVDSLYSEKSEFYLSSVKRKYTISKNKEERPLISRITMHASTLEFFHPKTNEIVKFEAEYPKDFAVTLKQLRKFDKLPDHLDDEFFNS